MVRCVVIGINGQIGPSAVLHAVVGHSRENAVLNGTIQPRMITVKQVRKSAIKKHVLAGVNGVAGICVRLNAAMKVVKWYLTSK